uniref:Uncharacterized protein n=1 Tax=Anguilla anguilla TaxID=7936 RepID=A0A0E9VM12_ANGAN
MSETVSNFLVRCHFIYCKTPPQCLCCAADVFHSECSVLV